MNDGRLLVFGAIAALGAASALRARGSSATTKRRPAPYAAGARVALRVKPGFRDMYGPVLPADGSSGVVAAASIGQTTASHIDGPRGGLVFVDFGTGHPIGVSPEDLGAVGSQGIVRKPVKTPAPSEPFPLPECEQPWECEQCGSEHAMAYESVILGSPAVGDGSFAYSNAWVCVDCGHQHPCGS